MSRQHNIKVKCRNNEDLCDLNFYALYPELDHPIYKVELMMNLDGEYFNQLDGQLLSVYVVSEKFTRFLIITRYFFFALSTIMLVIYFWFFFRAPKITWTFEHKAIAILSVFLIFFNDPFYYLTVYRPSAFMAVLSSLEVVFFISFLLFFWIVMM